MTASDSKVRVGVGKRRYGDSFKNAMTEPRYLTISACLSSYWYDTIQKLKSVRKAMLEDLFSNGCQNALLN